MRALLFLPFLLGTGAFGYWLGVRDRRTAIAAVFDEVVPLLRATRDLVAADPTSTAFSATRAVAQYELDHYESQVRRL